MFEINLVPLIKDEAIKAQKKRNLVIFLSVITGIASIVVIVIFSSIKVVQDLTISSKNGDIKALSDKVDQFTDLDAFVSLQNQINELSVIAGERKSVVRVFDILNVIAPLNGDELSYSNVAVDIVNNTISFDGQVDALVYPFIDFNTLDAFTKSIDLMRYDYGNYVDKEGREIRSVCILDYDVDGALYSEENRLYAIWTKGVTGCDPADEEHANDQVKIEDVLGARGSDTSVKIWRSPVIIDDLNGLESSLDIYESDNHFVSQCKEYYIDGNNLLVNNSCSLFDGITISNASNARDSVSGALVLSFSAVLNYNPDVLFSKNKHMVSIAPDGSINVTDSYLYTQNMFKEEAIKCLDDDKECQVNNKELEDNE